MNISATRLHEFQAAYEEDFDECLSIDEAREMLTRLVTFYGLVMHPLPKNCTEEDK